MAGNLDALSPVPLSKILRSYRVAPGNDSEAS